MKDRCFRLVCSRPPGEWEKYEDPIIEYFQAAMECLAPGKFKISDTIWISQFRVHRRIVRNYRVGRMLLAVDAAHIHSAAGGQGTNAGMHDSINLGVTNPFLCSPFLILLCWNSRRVFHPLSSCSSRET
jgi:2-polyprenyl-6-methoxyphenol hydroxylase-like FAD-dependent oxidoreductase